MGAGQSRTRKLTIDNNDPTSVIKVSEDVVQRIKNNQESARAAPPAPPTVELPPAQQYIYDPIITSIQQRHANLTELKNNDKYWETRLKNLKEQHLKINKVLDDEYNRALEELDAVEKKATKQKPPCEASKAKVLKCYKLNAKEPMRCADEVRAFESCIDKSRAELIANRG